MIKPDGPALSSEQVHIWCVSLESLGAHSACFAQTLACDERARAERYHFLRDRNKFVIRRGVLRMMLQAFYNCWTRKEAYIKAVGKGLAQPLDQFEVSLEPGEPARLLNLKGCPHERPRWSLKSFTPELGYVAALAVEGHRWQFVDLNAP